MIQGSLKPELTYDIQNQEIVQSVHVTYLVIFPVCHTSISHINKLQLNVHNCCLPTKLYVFLVVMARSAGTIVYVGGDNQSK